MATDYRKRPGRGKGAQPRSKRRNQGRTPGWIWMLGGFLPGLFLALLVHLHHEGADDVAGSTGAGDNSGRDTGATAGDNGSRPRFEFYKLLSEMEVVVPDEPETPEGGEDAPPVDVSVPSGPSDRQSADSGATASADPDVQYLLQAGSFRKHGDADRLKARLALMGVEAEIQSVQIHGGETWHRVRIGPLNDRGRIEAVRERLQQEEVDSILLRLQG